MRPPLRLGQGAWPIDAELRLNQAPANNACSANVDGEPDGAAHPKFREDAAPPAASMDGQSPQHLRPSGGRPAAVTSRPTCRQRRHAR